MHNLVFFHFLHLSSKKLLRDEVEISHEALIR